MTENDKIDLQKALRGWDEIRQCNNHRIDALQAELWILNRQNEKATTLINILSKQLGEE